MVNMQKDGGPYSTSVLLALGLAGACAGLALSIILMGWTLGLGEDVDVTALFTAMRPTTALSFACLAYAVYLGQSAPGSLRRMVSTGLVLGVVALVVTNFAVGFLSNAAGLDGLFGGIGLSTDRMALAVGIGLLLACYCVYDASLNEPMTTDLHLYLSIFSISTASAVIAGHLQDVNVMYDLPGFEGMSLVTSIAFILLFIALLLCRLDQAQTLPDEE